jgi:hypothetical protein
MKIRLWLILSMMFLSAGCAPGYYAARPAYPEIGADRTRWGSGSWQNPETDSEQQMRIWRMESGR